MQAPTAEAKAAGRLSAGHVQGVGKGRAHLQITAKRYSAGSDNDYGSWFTQSLVICLTSEQAMIRPSRSLLLVSRTSRHTSTRRDFRTHAALGNTHLLVLPPVAALQALAFIQHTGNGCLRAMIDPLSSIHNRERALARQVLTYRRCSIIPGDVCALDLAV